MNERSFILREIVMTDHSLRRGEQTRKTIIEAAHDLFVQQGYHGTSMRQIAQRAGIALGGLYNHFESKEKVFESVFLEYHPYLLVIPVMLAVRHESIEAFAQDALRQMIVAMEERPDFIESDVYRAGGIEQCSCG